VQQRDAIRLQQRFELCEERAVVVDPDMLEHSDRHDPVVPSAFFAIVAQVKPDPIGKTRGCGAPRRYLVLLDREGKPRDISAAFAGEVECEPAPAGADIKHPLTGED